MSDVAALRSRVGALRVILLIGDDVGLISERSRDLFRAAGIAADDPFGFVTLDRESVGRLSEEMAARSLMGGRRGIRVTEVAESVLTPLRAGVASTSDTLVVLEAPGLAARGRLRSFIEGLPGGVCLPCYVETGPALASRIVSMLEEAGCSTDREAMSLIGQRVAGDAMGLRSEIEKLSLYAGPGGRIDVDSVEACVGDAAESLLDDALFAATAGRVEAMDTALERLMDEGVAPVAVARAALNHLHRLRQGRLAVDAGTSAADAAKSARPPVFFRRVADFRTALSRWTDAPLRRAEAEAFRLEASCKSRASRGEAMCRRFLFVVAARARS